MKQEIPIKWILVGALAVCVVVAAFFMVSKGSNPSNPKEAGLGAPALPGGGTMPVDPKTNLPYPPGEGPKTSPGPNGPGDAPK
jgi:hypothetical protein